MRFEPKIPFGTLMMCAAVSVLGLSACSKKAEDTGQTSSSTTTSTTAPATTAPATETATTTTTTATPAASAAPAADNTDTKTGVKLASFTGDATKGATDFVTCKTCHAIEAGVNKIGPSLHNVVGRKAGSIPGFSYSTANKSSGITWTPEKLFQYLEAPQRVVPGTKMTFAGFPDPQKRADVIAYLKAN